MATTRPLAHVTFRVSTETRNELDSLASASQRTLAQLVRTACEIYLKEPPQTKPKAILRHPDQSLEGSVHVGVRLEASMRSMLLRRARVENRSLSEVLRASVESWIAKVDRQELGTLMPQEGSNAKN